jgi:hypothetical protein
MTKMAMLIQNQTTLNSISQSLGRDYNWKQIIVSHSAFLDTLKGEQYRQEGIEARRESLLMVELKSREHNNNNQGL